MNMTDIQCFIKVTELMSFTKAAEALYTSQQAVSLHIKHLENTYKVQLFIINYICLFDYLFISS